VYPLMGRLANPNLNQALLGMSPAIWGDRPWFYEYSELPDLSQKVALITGANSGVGFWTALHLARKGAHVLVGCRSASKCSKAVDRIKANSTSASVEVAIVDVSRLASVKAFATDFLSKNKRLDILVLNAGIAASSLDLTEDNIEPVFATNHVGHQLLYMMLEKTIVSTGEAHGDARVVVVSSASHFDSTHGVETTRKALNDRYSAAKASGDSMMDTIYPQSKLANVLFAQEAARRVAGKPVYVNSLHPGGVDTKILDNSMAEKAKSGLTMKDKILISIVGYFKESLWTSEDGALTQVYLAAASDVRERDISGSYFHPQAVEVMPCHQNTRNLTLQRALWTFTEELIEGRG